MRKRKLILTTAVIVFAIVAFAIYRTMPTTVHTPSNTEKHRLQLPGYFYSLPKTTKEAYEFAILEHKVLEHMACYCGCNSIGHTSNKSCFVKEIRRDSTVILDAHGTDCNVCIDIALTTRNLLAKGKTLYEIRSILDSKYVGYPSTTTPYPPR